MNGVAVRKERPARVARSVVRRDTAGVELGTVDLDPEFFGIEPNLPVLHQVITAQLAAARSGTQSTKTRSEVSGGGAKPFRQKGTGRARQGSTRAPNWSGGGISFGPKPRSYRQKTPKKMVRLALCSALSDRAAEERVALVDAWRFEVPKTKDAVTALDALGLDGKVLVVLSADDLTAERSFANLPDAQAISVAELSAYDILRNDWIVFTDETLPGGQGATALAADSGPDDEVDEADEPVVDEVDEPVADADAEVDGLIEADEPVVADAVGEVDEPADAQDEQADDEETAP